MLDEIVELGKRRYILVTAAQDIAGCSADELADICLRYEVPFRFIGRDAIYLDELALLTALADLEMIEPQIRAPYFDEGSGKIDTERFLPTPAPEKHPVIKHFLVPIGAISFATLLFYFGLQVMGDEEPKPFSAATIHSAVNALGTQQSALAKTPETARQVEVSAKPGPMIVADAVYGTVETVLGSTRDVTTELSARIARGESTGVNTSSPRPGVGMVVVPSQGEEADEAFIEAIKRQFSDDVTVRPEGNGERGVIQPVFRDGPGDEYLYILLPVEGGE